MSASAAKQRLLVLMMMLLLLFLPLSPPLLLLPLSRAGAAKGRSGAGWGAAEAAPTGAMCEAGCWGPRGIMGAVGEGWFLLGKQGEARER